MYGIGHEAELIVRASVLEFVISGMTVITWVTSMTTMAGSNGVAGLSRIN